MGAVTTGTRLQINLVTDNIEAANGLKYELEDLALEKLHNVTVTNSLNCDILFFCNESKPLADDTRLTVNNRFRNGCFEISKYHIFGTCKWNLWWILKGQLVSYLSHSDVFIKWLERNKQEFSTYCDLLDKAEIRMNIVLSLGYKIKRRILDIDFADIKVYPL